MTFSISSLICCCPCLKSNKQSSDCRAKTSSRLFIKWAASWQNQQNGMCAQRRLRSAWASVQYDQSYPLSAQRRLCSDCVNTQADPSLRLAHMPFCWVCHYFLFVMIRRLKCLTYTKREPVLDISQYCKHIWAASWQNQQKWLCAQWGLRSAWVFTQSDQSLRCALSG